MKKPHWIQVRWGFIVYTMKKTTQELSDVMKTGAEMGRIALTYCTDVSHLASLSVFELQEKIRKIQYTKDPPDEEHLSRPAITLNGLTPYFDCDDRSIVVGAWAKLNNLPFRFVAVGNTLEKPLHHVFAEVNLSGVWVDVDATYPWNRVGLQKNYAKRKVIFTWYA